jgi:hypothetical protein
MPRSIQLWHNAELLRRGVDRAAEQGYSFTLGGITEYGIRRLEHEIGGLALEYGDHETKPLHAGTKREITQALDRAYHAIDDPAIPAATLFANKLARDIIRPRRLAYPELEKWAATEAGYQLYRTSDHHIAKHRDRESDQLLAATITFAGVAIVSIHEPIGDPNDYTNTIEIDRVETGPGTVMFLRAPGFRSGQQVVHEVHPPTVLPRAILNLRMRPDILPSPTELAAG